MVAELRARAPALLAVAVAALLCVAQPARAAEGGASLEQQRFARAHPQLAAHDPDSDLPRPAPDAGWLGDTVAGGSDSAAGTVLVSSAPLRARDAGGQLVPVDLTLAPRAGAFVPAAAPVALALGSGSSATIALGQTASRSVVLRPLGEQSSGAPAGQLAGKLLFTDTYADTDTLLVPQADGAVVLQELRSAAAPTRFAYALELPAGATARVDDDELRVTDAGGDLLVRGLRPQAADASGRRIQARWELDGDDGVSLVLEPAGAGSVANAFPVVATTSFTSTYDWQGDPAQTGFGGWGTHESSPPPPVAPGPYFRSHFGDSSRGPGLELEPIGGRVYDNGDHTRVDGGPIIIDQFAPPGNTTIKRATFSHVDFLDDTEGIVLRMAVYGSDGAYGEAVDLAPPDFPNGTPVSGFSTTIDVPATERGTSVQIWMYSVCPDSPPGSGNFSCRFVANPSRTFGRIGSVALTLADYEQPGVAVSGDLPATGARWSRGRGRAAIAVDGSDPGSGVRSETLTVKSEGRPLSTVATHQAPCDPTHSTPELGFGICPATDRLSTTVALGDLPQGRTTYTATVRDLSGRNEPTSVPVLVDRSAPSVTALGPLTRLAASWLALHRPVTLNVRARDARSGVAKVELYAASPGIGRTLLMSSPTPCDLAARAPGAACPRDRSEALMVDPEAIPDGTTRLDIVTIDGAGNRAAPRDVRSLRLDRTSPAMPKPTGRRRGATATFRWAAVADKRPGAGLRGYDYRVRPVSGRFGGWTATRATSLTRHGLQPSTGYETQVRSCDRAGNCSNASSATVARAASVKPRKRKPHRPTARSRRNHDEAETFRPLLFFDHAEQWHPLLLDSYFSRTKVRQCLRSRCLPVRAPSDIPRNARTLRNPPEQYLDAPGNVNRPGDYRNTEGGIRQGFYYSLRHIDKYRFYNYWTFYKYNDAPYSDFPPGVRIKFEQTIGRPPVGGTIRVNKFIDFGIFDRHESDWEGMVVGVPEGSTRAQHPHFVAFSEHAGTFRYLFSVLQCGDHEVHPCRGTDARVRGYVANSTHATYPRPCSATSQGIGSFSIKRFTERAIVNIVKAGIDNLPSLSVAAALKSGLRRTLTEFLYRNHYCVQTGSQTIGGKTIGVTINLPEYGFDGATRWSQNSSRRALAKMPYTSLKNTWMYWLGNWNTRHELPRNQQGAHVPFVRSPGRQNRDIDPRHYPYVCTPRGDFSNDPPKTLIDISPCDKKPFIFPRAVPAPTVDEGCAGWMGALTDAVVCDPAALAQAMRNGTLDRAGGVTIAGDASEVAGATAALSQSVGDPLAAGQSLTLDGATGAGAQAIVRVADGSQTSALLFDRVGLQAGGRAVITANTNAAGTPAATLTEPDGTTVQGVPIDDPAINGTPADPVQVGGGTGPGATRPPRVTAVRARSVNRTVAVTFRPVASTTVKIEVLDPTGATIVSRDVRVSGTGQRRVVLPVGTRVAADVRLTPAGPLVTGSPVQTAVIL